MKYPAGTLVETFSQAVVDRAANKIRETDGLLPAPAVATAGTTLEGGTEIELPGGRNAV